MDFSLDMLKIVIVATGLVVFCHRNDCRWVLYVLAVAAALWKKAADRATRELPKAD